MTYSELEQRILTAAEHAAPDCLGRILSMCRQEDQFRGALPADEVLSGFPAVSFRVILDVNPSVCLEADGEGKILRAEARGVAGEAGLAGLTLDEAVAAVVGDMLREGYLSETRNSVLVSVEGSLACPDRELQKRVSGIVEEVMDESLGGTAEGISVLSQTVDGEDEELAALAAEYGISLGKAALILKVAGAEEGFGDLASLTVNEIALIAQDRPIPDNELSRRGHASERGYIGHDGALKAAAKTAGIDVTQLTKPKVTLDAVKGRMVYEVKLKTAAGTFKYVLDACTGEMVNRKKEKKEEESDMGKKKKYYKYYQGDYGVDGALNAAGSAAGAQPPAVPEGAVGEQAAKEAALRHAGVPESRALYVCCNPQIGHGPDHYDVKFVANGFKYKYAVGLYDGAVLGRAVKNKAAKGKYVYEGNYHEHCATMGPGMGQPAPEAFAPGADEVPAREAAPAPAAAAAGAGGMIPEQEAFDIAMRQAGLTRSELIRWKVKLRDKHGRLLYRFKFKIPGFEHEIDVDVFTGAVTKSHKEVDY